MLNRHMWLVLTALKSALPSSQNAFLESPGLSHLGGEGEIPFQWL